jgi:hypothetical protein
MTIDRWLRAAMADAEARGRHELTPLLQTLAQATRTLRRADVVRQEPVPRNRSGDDAPLRPAASDGD